MEKTTEQTIIERAKELRSLLNQSDEVQDNPIKRLAWRSALDDIIDYLNYDGGY